MLVCLYSHNCSSYDNLLALIRFLVSYALVNSTCAQDPPGYCGAFARLVSPGGGAFANFALPGGRAFANPGAIPEVLTRTRFPIRIWLHRRFYWKKSRLAHLSRTLKDRNKLKRVVKACSRFYACVSSLLIKPELHSEIGAIDVNQRFLVIVSNFCSYL